MPPWQDGEYHRDLQEGLGARKKKQSFISDLALSLFSIYFCNTMCLPIASYKWGH